MPEPTSGDTSRDRFARDALIASIAPVVKKAKGFVLIPIIAKLLGSEAFGVWKQFAVATTLLATVASLSYDSAINRYLSVLSNDEELAERWTAVVLLMLGTGCLGGAALLLLSDPAAGLIYGDSSWEPIVLVMVAYLPLQVLYNRFLSLLRARRWFGRATSVDLVRDLSIVGGTAAAAFLSLSIQALVAVPVLFTLLAVLYLAVSVHRELETGYRTPDFSEIPKYTRFSVPLLAGAVAVWLAEMVDRFVLVQYTDVETVGAYSAAYAIGGVVVLAVRPVKAVLLPDLSTLWDREGRDRASSRLVRIVRYYALVGAMAAASVAAAPGPLLRFLSSPEFVPAADVLRIVPAGLLLYGMARLLAQIATVAARVDRLALLWGLGATVNLGLNLLLVPRYGMTGAAAATAAAYLVTFLYCLYLTADLVPVHEIAGLMGRVAVAGLAGAAAGILAGIGLEGILIAEFVVPMLAGAAAFLGGALLIRVFTANEMKKLLDVVVQSVRP